jgi:transcriptional regulator with XRE-family HTH domain
MRTEKLIDQLSEKEYRDEFVADQVRGRIALLVRALREQDGRKWSQTDLGERMRKPQSVVSRIENPDHKVSLQTLLEVAAGFDLPLYVDILDWDDWFRRMSDFSTDKMHRQSFDAERLIAQAQAAALSATQARKECDANSDSSVRAANRQNNAQPPSVMAGAEAARLADEIKRAKHLRRELCISSECVHDAGCGCLESILAALRSAVPGPVLSEEEHKLIDGAKGWASQVSFDARREELRADIKGLLRIIDRLTGRSGGR